MSASKIGIERFEVATDSKGTEGVFVVLTESLEMKAADFSVQVETILNESLDESITITAPFLSGDKEFMTPSTAFHKGEAIIPSIFFRKDVLTPNDAKVFNLSMKLHLGIDISDALNSITQKDEAPETVEPKKIEAGNNNFEKKTLSSCKIMLERIQKFLEDRYTGSHWHKKPKSDAKDYFEKQILEPIESQLYVVLNEIKGIHENGDFVNHVCELEELIKKYHEAHAPVEKAPMRPIPSPPGQQEFTPRRVTIPLGSRQPLPLATVQLGRTDKKEDKDGSNVHNHKYIAEYLACFEGIVKSLHKPNFFQKINRAGFFTLKNKFGEDSWLAEIFGHDDN